MKRRRHNVGDAEFILEPISDSVVRVTYREQTGFFGLRGDWEPNRPYTWTLNERKVREDCIGWGHSLGIRLRSLATYSSSDAALKALCEAMLREQREADASRVNPEERKATARRVLSEMMEGIPELSVEEPPDDPGPSLGRTANEGAPMNDEEAMAGPLDAQQMVTVRLEDLCRIADSVASMMGDMDNGKWKYVWTELDSIHEVVERWSSDTLILGGGCHDHQRSLRRQF